MSIFLVVVVYLGLLRARGSLPKSHFIAMVFKDMRTGVEIL